MFIFASVPVSKISRIAVLPGISPRQYATNPNIFRFFAGNWPVRPRTTPQKLHKELFCAPPRSAWRSALVAPSPRRGATAPVLPICQVGASGAPAASHRSFPFGTVPPRPAPVYPALTMALPARAPPRSPPGRPGAHRPTGGNCIGAALRVPAPQSCAGRRIRKSAYATVLGFPGIAAGMRTPGPDRRLIRPKLAHAAGKDARALGSALAGIVAPAPLRAPGPVPLPD